MSENKPGTPISTPLIPPKTKSKRAKRVPSAFVVNQAPAGYPMRQCFAIHPHKAHAWSFWDKLENHPIHRICQGRLQAAPPERCKECGRPLPRLRGGKQT